MWPGEEPGSDDSHHHRGGRGAHHQTRLQLRSRGHETVVRRGGQLIDNYSQINNSSERVFYFYVHPRPDYSENFADGSLELFFQET